MDKKQTRRELYTAGAGIHVREAGEGQESRTITGYAILFDTESAVLWSDEGTEVREVIAPEAVTQDLLDASDIKFTMFHNRQLILARSNQGKGTLSYAIDEKGVSFEFDAPKTADGDKALELVRRGDLSGCSFAFSTDYFDHGCVERQRRYADGKCYVTYRVKEMHAIYDMTLAADPAYPDTSVEAREWETRLRAEGEPKAARKKEVAAQVAAMRREARKGIVH